MYFGSNTWKKRWARPSWLTRVPSPSAKLAAGSTRSARLLVAVFWWSATISTLAASRAASTLAASVRVYRSFSSTTMASALPSITVCSAASTDSPPSMARPRLLASGTTRLMEPFLSRSFKALAMLAAASISALEPSEVPAMISGRLAASRASAMSLASSRVWASRTSTAGALAYRAWATAKPMRARSSGAACTHSSATSSSLVSARLAINSGFSACWPMFFTAASSQGCTRMASAMSSALPFTDWRRARAIRAAVWVRSSPSTKMASWSSMSRMFGTGSGLSFSTCSTRRMRSSSPASIPL
ncbi:MAG: hypothetical protein GAK37_03809 [Pseudomonas sp.]|nr:MAG: hypothetical protein GAK37_03809 [Pseudomonas sp.]